MEFCFFRASRSHLLTGAIALGLTGLMGMPLAQARQAAPAAAQKNYKDRGEYDLYSKITQTQDPKARLELLNTWQDKYPQSDFAQDRLQYFVATLGQLAQSDPPSRQKLIDKAEELLKVDPKNFTANYYVAFWGPQIGGTSAPPDLLTEVDTSAHAVIDGADAAFPAAKKPASTSDADWAKAKNQVVGIAHYGLAWEASQKKDNATAENEFKQSLTANPDQGRVSYLYAKLLQDEKKYPEALFEYGRAAQYDGADAVPASARPQLLDYFKKVYAQFHGSADGADQVLAQAKTAALPPDGFKLEGAGDIENKKVQEVTDRMNSDPAFKLWYTIEQNLVTDQGPAFFNSNVKDTEIPGGAGGVKNFAGTVISVDPQKVVLGVDDPAKPDASLEFSAPLPADAIKVGQKLEFSGIADSFTKDPYMLTFKDPTIPGVQTTPRKTTPKRHRASQ